MGHKEACQQCCQAGKFLVDAHAKKERCGIAQGKADAFHFGFEGQSRKVTDKLTKPVEWEGIGR